MQDCSNITLSVSNAIRTSIQGDNKAGLGDRELQVLEHVTREHSHGRCVFMEDGMSLKYLGSPYTLRKSIQKLIDLDYLCLQLGAWLYLIPSVKAFLIL